MRAVQYAKFGGPLRVVDVPAPAAPAGGAVVRVGASGICRSDWHGWRGHDPGIELPHVPGHELAGTVSAVGAGVRRWAVGDRVTVPFVCACGTCPRCRAGDGQVCDRQTQPGFTHWGSFAEYVVLAYADVNLVRLPPTVSFETAAALGCRYATAFRAVRQQGRVAAGDWVAVHGCGGVGLSAVQVAIEAGARVVAVDVDALALELAAQLGAEVTVSAAGRLAAEVGAEIRDTTGGGAHVALDACGSPVTCAASVWSLRPRGRHVQVGLLPPDVVVPMARVIAHELELFGSHGLPAAGYPELLDLVVRGRLRPDLLVRRRITLDEVPAALAADRTTPGMTVVTSF